MSVLRLFKTEVADKFSRENFIRLEKNSRESPLNRCRFVFREYSLASDTTTGYPVTMTVPHNLGYRPLDIIQMNVSPDTVSVTWNYDSFDTDDLSVTISAACTVRVLVGRHGDT